MSLACSAAPAPPLVGTEDTIGTGASDFSAVQAAQCYLERRAAFPCMQRWTGPPSSWAEHTIMGQDHRTGQSLLLNSFSTKQHYADYSMYSTFLTASPGSVLFSRSTLLKRKDLCFSCLRLGLIRHRRRKEPHTFSQSTRHVFCGDTSSNIIYQNFHFSHVRIYSIDQVVVVVMWFKLALFESIVTSFDWCWTDWLYWCCTHGNSTTLVLLKFCDHGVVHPCPTLNQVCMSCHTLY